MSVRSLCYTVCQMTFRCCLLCGVQSKRLKLLAVTRQNIAKLLDELELSPNCSFEHDVVYDPESVSVTTDSMRAVKRYNDEVLQTLCVLLSNTVYCVISAISKLYTKHEQKRLRVLCT